MIIFVFENWLFFLRFYRNFLSLEELKLIFLLSWKFCNISFEILCCILAPFTPFICREWAYIISSLHPPEFWLSTRFLLHYMIFFSRYSIFLQRISSRILNDKWDFGHWIFECICNQIECVTLILVEWKEKIPVENGMKRSERKKNK